MTGAANARDEPSPREIIDEVLLRVEQVISDLAEAADELTGAPRVRAITARLEAIQKYLSMSQQAGRVPPSVRLEVDARHTAQVVLRVFDRWDVPAEARDEIYDILTGGVFAQRSDAVNRESSSKTGTA